MATPRSFHTSTMTVRRKAVVRGRIDHEALRTGPGVGRVLASILIAADLSNTRWQCLLTTLDLFATTVAQDKTKKQNKTGCNESTRLTSVRSRENPIPYGCRRRSPFPVSSGPAVGTNRTPTNLVTRGPDRGWNFLNIRCAIDAAQAGAGPV